MSRDSHSSSRFWIGLAAGALGGLALGHRLASPPRMPHLNVWQRALGQSQSEIGAAVLAGRMQTRYEDLYARRPRFAHRVLRVHLDKIVLPGLALYQTLLEENDDRKAVLAEVETLFETTFVRFSRVISLLNAFPDSFTWFRRITRRTVQVGFPPAGWEIKPVQDDERCIAFDYTRCFYLDLLTVYGVPELAPLYCKMDDMLYESLPSQIVWRRSGTLAQGDECCDFRWCWEEGAGR